MKRVQQKVHSAFSPRRQRMFLIAAGIALQFAIYVVLLVLFSQYFVYFYWICVLVSLVMALFISTWKSKLAYKIAWIIPILLVPLIGGVMFIILGGARDPHYHREETRRTLKRQLPSRLSTTDLMRYGPDAMQQAWYLGHAALCPAYTNTETAYFSSGASFFPNFLEELEQAKDYIFLEYFIIAEGSMWSDVLDILTRKAAQGVDVRVIYDGVGSAATLPINYPDQLHARGILCRVFQPLLPVLSIHQNNRDHRKICVIDGVTGFVSGLNMADEYIDRKERFGYWKDNALRLRGEAVWSLTVFFLTMWDHQNPRSDFRLFRPRTLPPLNTPGGIVVPYTDTPNPADTVCADLHLQMITKAKRYLYLTTPYLAIDETITSALCTAARSGVDVRIMTPHIPDKKVVFAVTQSNYPVLLEAGARIYEFTPGFIHSKTVVADDLYASVGSCNLDYRSFYLQFENGVWLCGDPAVLSVRDDFLQTLEVCQEITLADCRTLPLFHRLLQSIYRLFAPLF